ncbi:hypothetical protein GCM10025864_22670 [Luteimicrobium album]|uniref:Major facilitator superfamily (MFS) profile domain-containing protein n=1 Tax=Luteimicrobium album TaxID=1054550 RepID=A0ABQ6I181_9MICO|nr:hypothetical protein GCM10025864_22670 [Luteimicrobium album]
MLTTRQLAILAAGTFALGVDAFVVAGLLPQIARDLHVTAATDGQLTTAFALTYAVGSPALAAATGRWDRRTLLVLGLGVFLLGMVAQAAGPTYAVVLGGRVVAALGAAAFQANAYAVAGLLTTDERRARSSRPSPRARRWRHSSAPRSASCSGRPSAGAARSGSSPGSRPSRGRAPWSSRPRTSRRRRSAPASACSSAPRSSRSS